VLSYIVIQFTINKKQVNKNVVKTTGLTAEG
jgi:hypothetical protein